MKTNFFLGAVIGTMLAGVTVLSTSRVAVSDQFNLTCIGNNVSAEIVAISNTEARVAVTYYGKAHAPFNVQISPAQNHIVWFSGETEMAKIKLNLASGVAMLQDWALTGFLLPMNCVRK